MNLQHLKYFDVLAKEQHYTRSSKLLNITQPSLSNAIASLEDELGIQLFEKKGRNVVLTKPGTIFHDYVERTLNTLDSGIDTLYKIGKGFGHISFAFLPVLGTSFAPKLAKNFLVENPDKQIQFEFHSASGVTKDIVDGIKNLKYDIAICSYLPNEPEIEFIPIASQELVVITPLDHPLVKKDSIDLSETLPYPQIGFSRDSGLRSIIDNLFETIDGDYNIIFEVTVDQVIAGLVSQGFGIAVVPNMPILDILPVKRIHLEKLNWERYFYLVTNKEVYLTPAVENFRQFVIDNSDASQIIF